MNSRRFAIGLFAVGLIALAMGGATVARAGVDVDLGASIPLGDNGHLFVNIASRCYDMEPQVVQHWAVRYDNPDDLAVALFLSNSSHRSPDVIFALRHQGLSWWDVGLRVGVPVDAWYVPVQRDPGPPYGRAYGYWRKHQQNPKYIVVLKDADARNLVALRMAHDYYGVPPDQAMTWRTSSHDVRTMMVDEYHKRHAPPGHGGKHEDRQGDDDHGKHQGKDHGNGNGKGNGHGKGHS